MFLHAGILWWNCWVPHCNLLGWNISLALAGLFLILPWRDTLRKVGRKCGPRASLMAVFLLAYPATYYINGASGYFSYCVYVPNYAGGELRRPGEDHHSIMFMPYDVINFPLPPGHSIEEAYFEKIRRPTDELLITDPRPWAQHHGMGNRRLTDDGELRDNQPYGHWVHRNPEGKILSEGDILNGKESRPLDVLLSRRKKSDGRRICRRQLGRRLENVDARGRGNPHPISRWRDGDAGGNVPQRATVVKRSDIARGEWRLRSSLILYGIWFFPISSHRLHIALGIPNLTPDPRQ